MQAYDNTLLVSIVSTLNTTIAAIAEDWEEDEDTGVVYRMVDYSDKIAWVLENFALHSSIKALAAAALQSDLDTMVREDLYETIADFAVA